MPCSRERALRREQVVDAYVRLSDDPDEWETLLEVDPAVEAFVAEITARWPQIDDVPNDEVDDWAPDGHSIVFHLEDHGLYSLMRMNADGTHPKTIFGPSAFRPRNIDWGPRTDEDDEQ